MESKGTQKTGLPRPPKKSVNEYVVCTDVKDRPAINNPLTSEEFEDVSEALSLISKENLISGQPLFKADLTAGQILFLNEIRRVPAKEWVQSLEVFFEIAVIDGPDFQRVHYDTTAVKNFWHLLSAFKNL